MSAYTSEVLHISYTGTAGVLAMVALLAVLLRSLRIGPAILVFALVQAILFLGLGTPDVTHTWLLIIRDEVVVGLLLCGGEVAYSWWKRRYRAAKVGTNHASGQRTAYREERRE